MKRLLARTLLSLAALFTALAADANVFTLVQSSGPDLTDPQPGEIFGFEVHYEQLTALVSLGFSVRTTGGVQIVSAVTETDCYGPFPPIACDFSPLSEIAPSSQFDVSDSLAGPWSYIATTDRGGSGVAAGTIDDSTGPAGALLGSVTVEYTSPGTLEIFQNTNTDDETYAHPQVITPTFDDVALPAAEPPAKPLSVRFVDPSGDWDPPISVDLLSLELAFDPVTGDYELVWEAYAAHPFFGTFRLNANLYNPDTGSNDQDPAFFSDSFNDFTLATPQTRITLTGTNPRLTSWSEGDRVAASCPDPLGCPNGGIFFQTAVGPLSGSAVGVDAIVPQFAVISANSIPVPALSAPAIALLVVFVGGVATAMLRMRRDRSPDEQAG